MIVQDYSLKQVDEALSEASSATGFEIKSLSATLTVNGADSKKVSDRTLKKIRNKREADNPQLQLIVYGVNNNNEIIKASDIKR